MNIVVSYAAECDKGEGRYFSNVFRRLGHIVHEINPAASPMVGGRPGRTVRGYPSDVDIETILEDFAPVDLLIYVDPLGLVPRGLERCPVPTVCMVGDVHRDLQMRVRLAALFDYVFLYHRNYIAAFSQHPAGAVHWLPYACDPDLFHDLKIPRDIDVAFVGHLFSPTSDRTRIVRELQKTCNVNPQQYYPQSTIPKIYSAAKIVLNLPLGDDLNYRFFEALSCGAMLLTRRVANGQELLFKEDVHYVAFSDDKELFQKVQFYLDHSEERNRIARAGYEEIQRAHTLDSRLNQLLELVLIGPGPTAAPARHIAPRNVRALYTSLFKKTGKVEALLRMAGENSSTPLARAGLVTAAMTAFARRSVRGW